MTSLDDKLNRIDRRLIRLEIMIGAIVTVQVPVLIKLFSL